MDSFEEFRQHLQNSLTHLYDPAHRPAESVWAVIGIDPQQDASTVHDALRQGIERLRPGAEVPQTARGWRVYRLLIYRYVHHLTQEATAEHLCISPRHLRREQDGAVDVLARRLWDDCRVRPPAPGKDMVVPPGGSQSPEALERGNEVVARRAQVRQELAFLQNSSPHVVAELGPAILRAAEASRVVAGQHGVSVDVDLMKPNLSVAVHPSALRQMLITVIGLLAQQMPAGRIVLQASHTDECVLITITCQPLAVTTPLDNHFLHEALAAYGGRLDATVEGDHLILDLELPSASEVRVLVVDDNEDLVHFYKRYVEGTRYRIVHLTEGQYLWETIDESKPDVIIMDVMLPDTDGWELLSQIRRHPESRDIPVIICSVVRQEELALALGASLYLPKPVRRLDLLQGLAQVLTPS